MRSRDQFLSAVHFLFATSVLVGGIFCLLVDRHPKIRSIWLAFLEQEEVFTCLGLALIALGVCTIVGLYFLYRSSFYQVVMGKNRLEIDPKILHQYVHSFWEQKFPGLPIQSEIVVHSPQKLEVMAYFPNGSYTLTESELGQIETGIGTFLRECVGYSKEFLFTVVYI